MVEQTTRHHTPALQIDRSPGQRATSALVALFRQTLPSAALALHLRRVRGFVQSADSLFGDALLNTDNYTQRHK